MTWPARRLATAASSATFTAGPGQLRTVSIAKGPVFCLPQHLESYAADVSGRLAAADRLRGLARDPFITALVRFVADANALHPFREGNGHAQRAFFSQLAHDAGHHIAWVHGP